RVQGRSHRGISRRALQTHRAFGRARARTAPRILRPPRARLRELRLPGLSLRECGLRAERPEAPGRRHRPAVQGAASAIDRKSTRLNSSHVAISYAVFCLKKKKPNT